MKKKIKKAFTLVELLVVIAILAILATVSIVGYNSFTKKAKVSNDTALVSQLNTLLKADSMVNGDAKTPTDALKITSEAGYDVEKLTPTASDYDIIWNQKTNQFALLDEKGTAVYGEKSTEEYKNWKFVSEYNTATDYSVYLKGTAFTGDLEVKAGIDVGNNTNVNTINYKNDVAKDDVVIRTNGGTLTVNGENDTISHYGSAVTISVQAVANNSYHEYGEVFGNIEITKGRVALEKNSKVSTVLVNSKVANDVKVDVGTSASVGSVAPTTEAAKSDINASSTIPTDSKVEEVVDTTKTSLFAGGLGTEKSPYLIAQAGEFEKIALFNDKMANEGMFFNLLNDIDLTASKMSKSISDIFQGEINGMNHKIKVGNNFDYLFNYVTGNTLFKNFTIELCDVMTKITFATAVKDNNQKVSLTYDNVDVLGVNNTSYNIGVNNSAYYANGTFSASRKIVANNGQACVVSDTYFIDNLFVKIINCDVNANFTMSGDRAAVFCGGQVYKMNIEVTNCSYSGTFYGANPGLVFANSAYCDGENLLGAIKLNSVKLLGNLVCLNKNNEHGLTFANSSKELSGVEKNGNMIECATDSTMNITASGINNEYVITKANDSNVDSYLVQLSLGKLFWYDSHGEVTNVESSNHKISIVISSNDTDNTGLFKCNTMSLKQAQKNGISTNNIQWKFTNEGDRYAFIDYNETKLLILDVNGEFASINNNVACVIGNIGEIPTYYKG